MEEWVQRYVDAVLESDTYEIMEQTAAEPIMVGGGSLRINKPTESTLMSLLEEIIYTSSMNLDP